MGYGSFSKRVHLRFLSRAFLALDVAQYGSLTDMSDGTGEIASGPQGRQALAQGFELIAEDPGRTPLERLDHIVQGDARIKLDKKMDMVRHDFHGADRDPFFVRDLLQDLL